MDEDREWIKALRMYVNNSAGEIPCPVCKIADAMRVSAQKPGEEDKGENCLFCIFNDYAKHFGITVDLKKWGICNSVAERLMPDNIGCDHDRYQKFWRWAKTRAAYECLQWLEDNCGQGD